MNERDVNLKERPWSWRSKNMRYNGTLNLINAAVTLLVFFCNLVSNTVYTSDINVRNGNLPVEL